jgi:hypothetical protein
MLPFDVFMIFWQHDVLPLLFRLGFDNLRANSPRANAGSIFSNVGSSEFVRLKSPIIRQCILEVYSHYFGRL